jgi:hypothetical protein
MFSIYINNHRIRQKTKNDCVNCSVADLRAAIHNSAPAVSNKKQSAIADEEELDPAKFNENRINAIKAFEASGTQNDF